MPQFERRLYESSDDMRAFDGDIELEDEGSRLPLLIVIALVVLASFAGVVWLAYTQGVQRGRESTPRIIATQPARKAASLERNPYAGLNIYKPSKPNDEQIEQDNTRPPAARSVSKPTTTAPSVKSSLPVEKPTALNVKPGSPPVQAVGKTPRMKPLASGQNQAAPPTKATKLSAAIPPKSNTRVTTAAPRIIAPPATLEPMPRTAKPTVKSASAAPKSTPAKNAAKPTPLAAMTKTTTQTATQSPPAAEKGGTAAAPQAPAPAGGYVLQIGSYKSESEASASWQSYKAAHPVVAGYESDIHRAELGAKGTWYRLRVGPFAGLSEANAACAKLKASGGNCFPAKR